MVGEHYPVQSRQSWHALEEVVLGYLVDRDVVCLHTEPYWPRNPNHWDYCAFAVVAADWAGAEVAAKAHYCLSYSALLVAVAWVGHSRLRHSRIAVAVIETVLVAQSKDLFVAADPIDWHWGFVSLVLQVAAQLPQQNYLLLQGDAVVAGHVARANIARIDLLLRGQAVVPSVRLVVEDLVG